MNVRVFSSVDSIVSSATSKICGQDVTANKSWIPQSWGASYEFLENDIWVLMFPNPYARRLSFACFARHFSRFDSSADCRPSSICPYIFGVAGLSSFSIFFFFISPALRKSSARRWTIRATHLKFIGVPVNDLEGRGSSNWEKQRQMGVELKFFKGLHNHT